MGREGLEGERRAGAREEEARHGGQGEGQSWRRAGRGKLETEGRELWECRSWILEMT